MIIPIDAFALLSLGLILLLAGGHYLIPGTLAISTYLKLSPALIATILVAGGTSAPELIVSINAALVEKTDLIWGNIVGSNITNILLVLGIGALFAPIAVSDPMARRDSKIMFALTVFVVGFAFFASALPVWACILLLIFLAAYIWQAIRNDEISLEDEDGADLPIWQGVLFGLGGIAGLLIGAELIVDNAVIIAREVGISETIIGLTIIAIGTSLPEVAAVVASMIRGRADVALGNIVGSNIFNIAAVMGVAGLFGGLPVPDKIFDFALPIMVLSSALLLGLITAQKPISRPWGVVFIGFFGVYLTANIMAS